MARPHSCGKDFQFPGMNNIKKQLEEVLSKRCSAQMDAFRSIRIV